MRHFNIKKLNIVIMALIMLLVIPLRVQAMDCSVTVDFITTDTKHVFSDADLRLYLVAAWDGQKYVSMPGYEEYDFNTIRSDNIKDVMQSLEKNLMDPTYEKKTDHRGRIYLDVEQGIYVLAGDVVKAGQMKYIPQTTLFKVPEIVDGQIISDVSLNVKYIVRGKKIIPPTPSPTPEPAPPKKVDTGDPTNIEIYFTLLAASLIVMAVLFVIRKRHR